MMPFLWLSQFIQSILRFIMPPRRPDEMRVFSKVKDVTNTSSLLSSLKENYLFLDRGLGNILVTKVEYCKCPFSEDSLGEHEFLLVTLKESAGARRTAFLVVDRLNDDTKKYRGDDELRAALDKHQSEEMNGIEETDSNSSSSSSTESSTTPATPTWHTTSRAHRSIAKVKIATAGDPTDALDRIIIFPNRRDVAAHWQFDVLTTMDLTQSQKVTLEHFAHLLRTTSRNTPQYHLIFAQCYWYAYTIWRVLEMTTQPRVYPHSLELAKRQCSHRLTGYGNRLVLGKGKSVNAVRSPETVKAQWESEKATEDEEWAELKRALHAPELAAEDRRREAEEGRRQAEIARRQAEVARQDAETRVRELERRLEGFERLNRSANAV
ncbi:hypothetical protein EV421DRAFT_368449 [Armillaria borealis]|uniref:Uncharacterized protein n=1 Tax=Armillaria borealis TaxID=47425 RepID=A0AA39MSU1_9AGAR|nr:hypothetical protein EV421DRAFT_368449 [Armillaria borealis]